MSKGNLPLKVEPFRYAEQGVSLHGTLSIADMHRLSSSIASNEGDAEIKMTFGVDDQDISFLRGHVKAQLSLQCQRCMETFSFHVENDFNYALMSDEEDSSNLPEQYDPVVVHHGILMLGEMVEDEIILSLPIVPMHDPKSCKAKLPFAIVESQQTSNTDQESPFKVIELLKSKRDKR